MDFPGGARSKEPVCQCRRQKRCRFDPWVRKVPWRRQWAPTPVFLPGTSHDRGAWWATAHRSQLDMTEATERIHTQVFSPILWVAFLHCIDSVILSTFLIFMKSNVSMFSFVLCLIQGQEDPQPFP